MLDDQTVISTSMGQTDQIITPMMIENYLRQMTHRLEQHSHDFKEAAIRSARADATYTFAHAKALFAAPLMYGKVPTNPMREAYAVTQTEEEYTEKTVAEAIVKALKEAGLNLRQAADCGRSVSVSVRASMGAL